MKKLLLSFIFSFSIFIVFGQAPEKFNYQGVARDISGNILVNQAISLRITLHSGTPTGSTVYQETHAATTDLYGVFSLEIGGGSVVSGVFSSIDWAGNTFYFQTEMDATGGTTYLDMGTTQLISVPYALHAKTAVTTTQSGAFGDFYFPDGIIGTAIILPLGTTSYTVPANKTFYMSTGPGVVMINNDTLVNMGHPPIFPENTTFVIGGSYSWAYTGFLVDKHTEIVVWHTSSSYTVPVGKTLYMSTGAINLHINGEVTRSNYEYGIFPSGTVLSDEPPGGGSYILHPVFTGYLK